MRKLIESTLVSLDGVIEAPERWARIDAEATTLSLEQQAHRRKKAGERIGDPHLCARLTKVQHPRRRRFIGAPGRAGRSWW